MPRTTPKEQEAWEGAGLDYVFLVKRQKPPPASQPGLAAQLEPPGTIEK